MVWNLNFPQNFFVWMSEALRSRSRHFQSLIFRLREKSLGQAAIHRVHLPGILFVVEATFHSVLRHWGGSGVKDRGVEDFWVSVSADLVIVVKSLCTTVACHNIVKINSMHLHARSTHTHKKMEWDAGNVQD